MSALSFDPLATLVYADGYDLSKRPIWCRIQHGVDTRPTSFVDMVRRSRRVPSIAQKEYLDSIKRTKRRTPTAARFKPTLDPVAEESDTSCASTLIVSNDEICDLQ